jgi:hypothetical protein
VALLIVAVLLSGCAATERTGFDYAGMTQKAGPPRPGQSRIVVLREKALDFLPLDEATARVTIAELRLAE